MCLKVLVYNGLQDVYVTARTDKNRRISRSSAHWRPTGMLRRFDDTHVRTRDCLSDETVDARSGVAAVEGSVYPAEDALVALLIR